MINTLRPRQNGRHFPDDIFKCIFLNEKAWISLKISLKFVPKVPINNIPALVQIMAWRWPGGKPLSEPMMVTLLTHICVTRPQWVNWHYDNAWYSSFIASSTQASCWGQNYLSLFSNLFSKRKIRTLTYLVILVHFDYADAMSQICAWLVLQWCRMNIMVSHTQITNNWTVYSTAHKVYLSLDKMAAISQTIFSDAFSWMKSFVFW